MGGRGGEARPVFYPFVSGSAQVYAVRAASVVQQPRKRRTGTTGSGVLRVQVSF